MKTPSSFLSSLFLLLSMQLYASQSSKDTRCQDIPNKTSKTEPAKIKVDSSTALGTALSQQISERPSTPFRMSGIQLLNNYLGAAKELKLYVEKLAQHLEKHTTKEVAHDYIKATGTVLVASQKPSSEWLENSFSLAYELNTFAKAHGTSMLDFAIEVASNYKKQHNGARLWDNFCVARSAMLECRSVTIQTAYHAVLKDNKISTRSSLFEHL